MSAGLAEDRSARRAAQTDFTRPLVLVAGAGTGKTAVLVARVVAWCCGDGWERAAHQLRTAAEDAVPEAVAARTLRRVVAITFTEAAAAEMASRVAAALLALRRGDRPPGLEAAKLPEPEALAQRTEALVGALDQLRVRTIHAFCRRLLAEHAVDARLRPGFEVDADGQRQAEVAREVLEVALPRAFGERVEPDFARLADAGLGPKEVEEALRALLASGIRAPELRADPFAPARSGDVWRGLAAAAAHLAQAEAGRLGGLKRGRKLPELSQAVAGLAAWLASAPVPDDARSWAARIRELGERWPADALETLRELARGHAGKAGGEALGDDLGAVAAAAAELHGWLAPVSRLDPELLQAARGVLAGLLEEAHQRLRALGVQTFGGLLADARDLLVGHPELARRLRSGIDQLLVDEFQDTDALQCELLAALVLEGPDDERPGLFLVGDPKQSIYGWRDADLGAYQEFVGRVEAAGGGQLPLVVNFRSSEAILAEVERMVAPVMREEPGWQPAFQPLLAGCAPAETAPPPGFAPVEHWVALGFDAGSGAAQDLNARDATRLEARALARDLLRLRAAGESLGGVGVLMRASTDFELVLGELREAGIPFVVEREEQHYRRREVVDALALVRCVLDPDDGVALVAALRCAAVGVPDAALVPLWRRQLPERLAALGAAGAPELAALQQDVREVAAALPAEVPGLARIAGWEEELCAFLAAVAELRERFETEPADRFVEALRTRLLLEPSEAARYLGAHRAAGLDRFFRDLVEALETSGSSAASVAGFLRRAGSSDREHEEGRPRSFGRDAVHVLTLHKAKGLGFTHVYWLQTHKQSGGERGRRTAVARRGGRVEYVLLGAATPGLRLVERDRERVDALERVRLLYVAATRAERRLVVSGRRELSNPSPPGDPEAVRSHVELLRWRAGGPADLGAAMAEASAAGGSTVRDEHGVLWRFPALEPEALPRADEEAAPGPDLEQVRRDEATLTSRREASAARAARPLLGAPSEHEAWREGREAEAPGPAASASPALPIPGAAPAPALDDDARAVALAAGSAVHAVLERSGPDAGDDFVAAVAASVAADELPARLAPAARERAWALWTRFQEGPLAARLRALAPHVLARELPLLLAAEDGGDGAAGPVAGWSGAIDLLYRDPEDGALVVADYKTDAVAPGPALEERARSYRGQGALYVAAVQRALGLPMAPRFELWFLQAGVIWADRDGAAAS